MRKFLLLICFVATAQTPISGVSNQGLTSGNVPNAGSCTNQVVTALVNGAPPTCSSITNAFISGLFGLSHGALNLDLTATGGTNFFLRQNSAGGQPDVVQPLFSMIGGTGTPSQVALGNVTNDVQTKAAIVPNTVPSTGQIPVGNAGGTAYAPVSVSGDSTVTSAGVWANVKLNGQTPGGTCTNQFTRSIDTSGRPTCASIVGADLPNPAASTLGGIKSLASVASKWINQIDTSGNPSATQPAAADISDYSTGTWTPVDGSAGALTFTGQSGSYVKVGKLVCAIGAATYPSTVDGSVTIVGGLPFTSSANRATGTISSNATSGPAIILADATSTTVHLFSAIQVSILNNAMSTKNFFMTICYST